MARYIHLNRGCPNSFILYRPPATGREKPNGPIVPRLARSRILNPPLPGPRQETRNTKQTHPARATSIRLNRSTVSRNTKHETRDTSHSRHKPGKYFSPHAHNNLAPHHPRTTPETLTPHATLQPRPVRIVHPINSPRLARTVRGCSCGEDSPAETIHSLVPTRE